LKTSNLFALGFTIFLTGFTSLNAQINYFSQAHAHNDYEHGRPLIDALNYGFTSVEADVHLKQNRLLIGHLSVNRRSPDLATLYLKPLDSLLRITTQGILPKPPKTFCLMLDLKTEGISTLEAIENELKNYPRIEQDENIILLISGQVPKKEMLEGKFKRFQVDGRPEDLGKGISVNRMPRISTSFRSISGAKARNKIETEALEKITVLARQVHLEGKLLRLWAIPDNQSAWDQLLDAGVDIINTDKLRAFNQFLTEKYK
jgi:hypothetical protein